MNQLPPAPETETGFFGKLLDRFGHDKEKELTNILASLFETSCFKALEEPIALEMSAEETRLIFKNADGSIVLNLARIAAESRYDNNLWKLFIKIPYGTISLYYFPSSSGRGLVECDIKLIGSFIQLNWYVRGWETEVKIARGKKVRFPPIGADIWQIDQEPYLYHGFYLSFCDHSLGKQIARIENLAFKLRNHLNKLIAESEAKQ